METKVCTKCKIEKEVTAFAKDKGQKSGLRPDCKECAYAVQKSRMQSEEAKQRQREAQQRYRERNNEKVKERQRQYEKTPQRRESKRIRERIYYHANPEHKKEINKRSYIKNFDKNREKKNEQNRNRWHSNEDFRKKMLQQAAEKYQANRELYCECCNKELPKYSIKYCDDCRDEIYRQKKSEWRNKVGKEYLNELQNKRVKKKVDELSDGYIAGQIRGNKYAGWKLEEMPKQLIELKRNVLKLKRELKNKEK